MKKILTNCPCPPREQGQGAVLLYELHCKEHGAPRFTRHILTIFNGISPKPFPYFHELAHRKDNWVHIVHT